MSPHFGRLARTLHRCTDQAMNAELEKMDLTAAQGHIMGYLAHTKHPPCPRDIEEEFHLSHPTVSGLLSRMEAKGFLEMRSDPSDRRIKRLFLLEKGYACSKQIRANILDNEARMVNGFSEEERELFLSFLQRAAENMSEKTDKYVKREEKTDD